MKKTLKEENPCWDGYEMVGMKMKDGKEVPNCVPKNESVNEINLKSVGVKEFLNQLMKNQSLIKKLGFKTMKDVLAYIQGGGLEDWYDLKNDGKKLGMAVNEANANDFEIGDFVHFKSKNKTGMVKKIVGDKVTILTMKGDFTGDIKDIQVLYQDNVNERLDKTHLGILKYAYKDIDKINPSDPAYARLVAHMDKMSKDELKQIAGADIKFLSLLAKNRLMRNEDHSSDPNDKYMVKPCDEPGQPWAVWEGPIRVKGFASQEEAQAYADAQNKEQGLTEGNAFTGALYQARKEGKKEFEFNGKTYPVQEAKDETLEEGIKMKKLHEGSFSEIDIMAREARNFNEFVKEFYRDYKDFPKDKETIKWLKSLYDGRSRDESVNEGVINELSADTYKNTVKAALQRGDSKGNSIAVQALQSFGKAVAKELAGKSFEVKGSKGNLAKGFYRGSSQKFINQFKMTFTGEGELINSRDVKVFGSDEVHFRMKVEFQVPDNIGGFSTDVKFRGYEKYKFPDSIQFSIKQGRVWAWYNSADTDLEFTRAGAREMAKLADIIVDAMDFPTKAKHNTIKQFDPMKSSNESVNEDTKKRFDVDFYKGNGDRQTSHEEIIRGDKFSDIVSQATKIAKSKGMNYIEFYYKDAFIGSIDKRNNYTFKKGRNSEKSPLSVNEGISPKDMDTIKSAVTSASSFMNIGAALKKTGLRYYFATSPMPIYIVQDKSGNRVGIVNKKYATKPDFVHGDTAVGVMESKSLKEFDAATYRKKQDFVIGRKFAEVASDSDVELMARLKRANSEHEWQLKQNIKSMDHLYKKYKIQSSKGVEK